MIELLDGDGSVLKAALADAIQHNRAIAESEHMSWLGSEEQSEEFYQAQGRADLFAGMLNKLNRRTTWPRNAMAK